MVAAATDAVAVCLDRMAAANVGSILITDDGKGNGKPVGILTERDLLVHWRKLGDAAFIGGPVSAIHSNPVFTLPVERIGDAAAEMLDRRIRHVPLVDDQGKLVGIMSMRDILVAQLAAGTLPRLKATPAAPAATLVSEPCELHVLTPTAQLSEICRRFVPGNWTTKVWMSQQSIQNLPALGDPKKLRHTAFMLDLDGLAGEDWRPIVKRLIALLAHEDQPAVFLVSSPVHFSEKDLTSLRAVAAKARWHVYQRPLPVGALIEDLRALNAPAPA